MATSVSPPHYFPGQSGPFLPNSLSPAAGISGNLAHGGLTDIGRNASSLGPTLSPTLNSGFDTEPFPVLTDSVHPAISYTRHGGTTVNPPHSFPVEAAPAHSATLGSHVMGAGALQLPRLTLSPVEVPFYQYLWSVADSQGTGYLYGDQAVEFFNASKLPQGVLHEIWRIADAHEEGRLAFSDFCAACRLVAHAQNGSPVTPESLNQEPPTVPQFDLSQSYSLLETTSGNEGSGSGRNAASTDPFLEAGTPKAYDCCGVPLEDIQRYSATFRSLPLDEKNRLSGPEAKVVLLRSGLAEQQLSQIWALADQDGDGYLTETEFIAAMHLTTSCRNGSPVPSFLPAGLRSTALVQFTLSLGPSSTRAMDVTPLLSPPKPETHSPSNVPQDSFWNIIVSSPTPRGSGRTLEDEAVSLKSTIVEDHVKKKKSKKTKSNKQPMGDDHSSFRPFVEPVASSSSVIPSDMESKSSEPAIQAERKSSHRILSKRREKSKRLSRVLRSHKEPNLESLSVSDIRAAQHKLEQLLDKETNNLENETSCERALSHSAKADALVAQHLATTVDAKALELRCLQHMNTELKAEIIREKRHLKRQLTRRADFEEQVQNLRTELDKMKAVRLEIDREGISVSRDLHHYQDEILFLKQQIDDAVKDIEHLKNANAGCEKSLRMTEEQIRQLDGARKITTNKYEAEKECLKKHDEQIAEMRATIERMRREKEDAHARYAVLKEKVRQGEQDRSLLLHAVETERVKLNDIQSLRVERASETARLAQIMAELDRDWSTYRRLLLATTSGAETTAIHKQSIQQSSTSEKPTTVGNRCSNSLRVAGTTYTRLPRDSKGVPAGALTYLPARSPLSSKDAIATTTDTLISSTFPSNTDDLTSASGPSQLDMISQPKNTPTTWTRFEAHGIDRLIEDGSEASSAVSCPSSAEPRGRTKPRRTKKKKYQKAATPLHSSRDESSEEESDGPGQTLLTALKAQIYVSSDCSTSSPASDGVLHSKTSGRSYASSGSTLSEVQRRTRHARLRAPGTETPSFGSRSLRESGSLCSL